MWEKKGIILCIDDEEAVVETLKEQILEYFGDSHEVITATSAEEALEIIDTLLKEGEIIEMIITDQVMPGMKGSEFLEKIRDILPDTIKILLTGYAGLESAIHAINKGDLDRYYEKPWNMDRLKEDIASLLEKFRQTIENKMLIRRLEEQVKELQKKLEEKEKKEKKEKS